ncbi:hypothetical protein D3C85_1465120 [compost metagenome]
MVGDPLQYVCQIGLRVQVVEFGRAHQAINCSGSFSTGIGTHEQIIFATQSDGAQRAFGSIVVDFNPSVIALAHQGLPPIQGIENRTAQCRFFRQLSQCLVEPRVQLLQQRNCSALPSRFSQVGWLAANLAFDGI